MEETQQSPSSTNSTLPNHQHHLGGMNYVAVTYFSGSLLIHLREYLHAENGDLYPTKKGITISSSLWASLLKKSNTFKEVLNGEISILNDCILMSKVELDNGPHVSLQKYYKKRDFSRQFCGSISTQNGSKHCFRAFGF